ncbi:MAG: DUF2911 domain-containing protein [Melioribacteraceae bacterium]|nr:DUF2911 domain-containing protein [Melioribacteraceae bacterium]
MKNIIINLLLGVFIVSLTYAQNDQPRLSPKASISQVIGYTEVTINYSRPGVKERTVWGELVPYDKVWRTGANEATTIEFNNDVRIEGNEVPKGKYSLFTIPGEMEWTIILNKEWEQWGAFKYSEAADQLRFKVKPQKSEFTERLTFSVDYLSPYSANIVSEWNEIEVSFKIETN